MSRAAPAIALMQPKGGYAVPLVHGFDTWKETVNVEIPVYLWERMAEAKARAVEMDDRRQTPIDFPLGDERFQIMPYGGRGGVEFLIRNDDLVFSFGSPKREWSVAFESTSAGVWEHGLEALRDRAYHVLEREGCIPRNRDDFARLSRIDYAFDIWSPAFTGEMRPALSEATVCPSKAKTKGMFVVQGGQMETLYIGSASSCQVRIYDKTKEIRQASGKVWLYELWEREGYCPPDEPADVWRIEVQLRAPWLKERNCNRPFEFLENQAALISDALFNRRLTVPQLNDSNRRRWPLHPMFVLALGEIRGTREFLPLGRKVTGRREDLVERLKANLAGTFRSAVVLKDRGEFSVDELQELAKVVQESVMQDREHNLKIRRAVERYEFVDEAQ